MTDNKKVIEFPATLWTFWDYVSPAGVNKIEEWRQSLSDDGQNFFDAVLKNARKTENHLEWSGWKRFLKGKGQKERLWELEFCSDGRQYRVIGKFGDARKQVILLIGCYHKQQVYVPSDALQSAFRRSKDLSQGRATIHERKIRIDW